jgi:hypothetical protein
MPGHITFEQRAIGLRGWARDQDAHVRAAVNLLIWHESWLRRADFTEACVTQHASGLVASINWYKAERFAATAPRASSSQHAILDLAVTLAQRDEYWLRFSGDAHAQAVVTAIAGAVGVDIVKPAGPRLAEPERWQVDDARKLLARWDQERGESAGWASRSAAAGALADRFRDVLAILDRVVPQGGDRGE